MNFLTKMTYVTTGFEVLSEDSFVPVTNLPLFPKPDGGLWASPFLSDGKISAWHQWCLYEDFDVKTQGVKFNLKDDARIVVIDSRKDFQDILKNYEVDNPLPAYLQGQHFLNWESLAKDVDAVFLTRDGMGDCHFEMFGWSVETLLIMNFEVIQQTERICFGI